MLGRDLEKKKEEEGERGPNKDGKGQEEKGITNAFIQDLYDRYVQSTSEKKEGVSLETAKAYFDNTAKEIEVCS